MYVTIFRKDRFRYSRSVLTRLNVLAKDAKRRKPVIANTMITSNKNEESLLADTTGESDTRAARTDRAAKKRKKPRYVRIRRRGRSTRSRIPSISG
jgi:hypothetical protein